MTVTRQHLQRDLQKAGFSYRESRLLVKVLFEVLTEQLKKTGKLELPFGDMTVKKPVPKRQYRLNKLVVTYKKIKVHFRSRND